MKNKIIIITIVLIVGFGIYFIVSNNNGSITPSNNSQTSLPPATSTLSNVTVNIQNFSFNPSTLNIKTGTKVTWVNNDNVSHAIMSDSGNLLNSGTLSLGQSFSFTFTSTGSVNYHCAIHPMMKGSIVVGN